MPAREPKIITSARASAASDPEAMTRRDAVKWMTLAWVGFAAAVGAALTATARFMFPNVLFEPPTLFKAVLPSDYGLGVVERWKERFGVWLVRNTTEVYSLISECVHMGCTPNCLPAQSKFKGPTHASGSYTSRI